MELSVTSNMPDADTLTLVDGSTVTGYHLLAEAQWGNAIWNIAYSGHRGTQGALGAHSTPENRPVVLPFRVAGSSKDDLAAKISALQSAADELRRFGGRITYRSNNQTHRQHLIVMGGIAAVSEWGNRAESHNRAVVVLEAACAPYVEGDPMEVTDPFSTDTLSEYTFDAGAGTLSISGGKLVPADGTQKRLHHADRGYTYSDVQVTLKYTTGASGAGDIGVTARRLDGSNYLRAYSDSTNLYVQYVDGGSATNIAAPVAHTARSASTDYWIRLRCEGNVITAEHFTAAPTPTGTPATTVSGTLTGAALTEFGAGVEGEAGMILSPAAADWRFDDFNIKPYTYRNQTLPQKLSLYGAIPGDAPAKGDVTVSTASADAAPFALAAWSPRAGASSLGSKVPFGIIEAEGGILPSGWSVTADADYRGGSGLQQTAVGSAISPIFSAEIDPATLIPDDHRQEEIDIEVWARFEIASSLTGLTIRTSVYPSLFGDYSLSRYAHEWGTSGKTPTMPSSGTRFRFMRLGTLTVPVRRVGGPVGWYLEIAPTTTGGTGVLGLDYVIVVPVNARALSPTNKALNTSYPRFLPAGVTSNKTVRSDLSGLIGIPGGSGNQTTANGLGGSPLELPVGNVDMLVKLSSLVPDDPTSDTTSETLAHTATVTVSPIPRFQYLRAE